MIDTERGSWVPTFLANRLDAFDVARERARRAKVSDRIIHQAETCDPVQGASLLEQIAALGPRSVDDINRIAEALGEPDVFGR